MYASMNYTNRSCFYLSSCSRWRCAMHRIQFKITASPRPCPALLFVLFAECGEARIEEDFDDDDGEEDDDENARARLRRCRVEWRRRTRSLARSLARPNLEPHFVTLSNLAATRACAPHLARLFTPYLRPSVGASELWKITVWQFGVGPGGNGPPVAGRARELRSDARTAHGKPG